MNVLSLVEGPARWHCSQRQIQRVQNTDGRLPGSSHPAKMVDSSRIGRCKSSSISIAAEHFHLSPQN